MADMKEIMSAEKADIYKKNFPAVVKYLEKFYDTENYLFKFKENDLIETRSNSGDYKEEHCPHTMSHIGSGIKWAIQKIAIAKDQKMGIREAKSGTTHPTWFEDETQASEALERVLLTSKDTSIVKKIQDWCNDRDIYYNDRKHNRLTISIKSNTSVGLGLVKGINYDSPISVHGIHAVIEYTISKTDGEFVIYDLYPYFTEEDWEKVRGQKKKK